jgi:SAM-dependent methyltransferase
MKRISWQAVLVSDFYTDLAADYHWLFPDDIVGATPSYGATSLGNQPLLESILDTLTSKSSILDCSCGIGADAIALKNRGFAVTASDGSPSMVAEARARVAHYSIDVDVIQARWEELPGKVAGPFDLVTCLGNSIVHTRTESAMDQALRAMRKVLRSGGTLVVDSRNWELLYKTKPRIVNLERVIERSNLRCCWVYVWSFPDDFSDPCQSEIVFLFEDADSKVTHRRYVIDYQPFTHDRLLSAMSKAGFRITHDSFLPGNAFYAVAGKAT